MKMAYFSSIPLILLVFLSLRIYLIVKEDSFMLPSFFIIKISKQHKILVM